MNILELVKNILGGKSELPAPEGYCPNCWGEQMYEGRFREKLKQEQIDLNNINDKRGWIQGYSAQHLEGIKLKESNDLFECPSCKLNSPRTSNK